MLKLEIVSDGVCPWCYIGLKRLDAAVALAKAAVPAFECTPVWRPFFLNPHTPPEGEPYLPFLIEKFGSRERVEAIWAHVVAAGQAYGLRYAFEKIAVRANTLDAHRLIHWAQSQGPARPLVEALFRAQFEFGENVGDRAVLLRVASACGYDRAVVADYLASAAGAAEVQAQEQHFRARGVSMVPTFIVADDTLVVGAEEPSRLAEALLAAWHRRG